MQKIKKFLRYSHNERHPLLLPLMTVGTATVLVLLLVRLLVTAPAVSERYAPLIDSVFNINEHATNAWLSVAERNSSVVTEEDRASFGLELHRASLALESLRKLIEHDTEVIDATVTSHFLNSIHNSLQEMIKTATALTAPGPAAYPAGSPSASLIPFTQSFRHLVSEVSAFELALHRSLSKEQGRLRQHSMVLLGFVVLMGTALMLLLRAILIDDDIKMHQLKFATQEIRRKNELLEKLAYFDHLTGLPNRPLFRDRVRQALLHAERTNRAIVIFYIDLDGFKQVNDNYGHKMGDLVLIEAAKCLSRSVRKEDTACRLSGDEFAILLANIPDTKTAVEIAKSIADKIIGNFSEPFALDGNSVSVSASIGITVSPSDGREIDQLLSAADSAMYLAKSRGKHRYQFYNAALADQEAETTVDSEKTLTSNSQTSTSNPEAYSVSDYRH